MSKFAQHVRVKAKPGKRDTLAAKFVETFDFLKSNPACELTLVSTSPDDPTVVVLTEVWTSAAEHDAAVESAEVEAWAAGMSDLVDGKPEIQRLDPVEWISLSKGSVR